MNNIEYSVKNILLELKKERKKPNNKSRQRFLSEECIPKSLKYDNYNSDTGEITKGQPRSLKYPELGKWGDGSCICKESSCLEFKPECCKKITMGVGPTEQGKKTLDLVPAKSWIGKLIEIPKDASVRPIQNCAARWQQISASKKTADPGSVVTELCEQLQATSQLNLYGFKNINQCFYSYQEARYQKCVDGGLWGFDYGNDKYSACWQLTQVFGEQARVLRPQEQIFLGYSVNDGTGGSGCGKFWNPTQMKPTAKKDKEDVSPQQSVVGGVKDDTGPSNQGGGGDAPPQEFQIYF